MLLSSVYSCYSKEHVLSRSIYYMCIYGYIHLTVGIKHSPDN